MKPCPFCAEEIQDTAVKCRHCDTYLDDRARPAEPGNEGVQAMIPTNNPTALMAYYMGCFSFIPPFGVVLGPVALIMGFMGRKKIAQDPRLPGAAHAWAGIILGGLVTLGYVAVVVAIALAPRR